MRASLPMYDLPEVRDHTDRLWAAVAQEMRGLGMAGVPQALERPADHRAAWRPRVPRSRRAASRAAMVAKAARVSTVLWSKASSAAPSPWRAAMPVAMLAASRPQPAASSRYSMRSESASEGNSRASLAPWRRRSARSWQSAATPATAASVTSA